MAREPAVAARMHAAAQVAAWLALCFALALVSYHYLAVKQSFFDDVFIYLHMARNAVESGTWQYFPVVERHALLASSPFKLVLLTLGTAVASILGFGSRTLGDAQVVLLLTGVIGWLVFAPFWRRHLDLYALTGTVYFLSATAFAAAFDFEGGLLFLWLVTLLRLLSEPACQPRALALLLPLGGLIRPDLALIVYTVLAVVAMTDHSVRRRLLEMRLAWLFFVPAVWILLALLFSVYPIPVTYWAKAAIPTLVEQASFLQKVFERIGLVMVAPGQISAKSGTTLGVLVVGTFASLSIPRLRVPAAVGIATVAVSVALFGRMPASFWWYYENLLLLMLALLFSQVVFESRSKCPVGWTASAFTIVVVMTIAVGSKSLRDSPGIWSFATPDSGRSKGYLFLARHANGDGTYTLPEVGRVLIKNPEMGITSYFTGKGAWIWDGAGLAQPLDMAEVRNSRLRYAYPPRLRLEASEDAQAMVDRVAGRLAVVEVWAMEDRNFEEARKKCRYVIVEGALCINPYREIVARPR
jgi:hypothetical protein